jgi:hypothetical protein
MGFNLGFEGLRHAQGIYLQSMSGIFTAIHSWPALGSE